MDVWVEKGDNLYRLQALTLGSDRQVSVLYVHYNGTRDQLMRGASNDPAAIGSLRKKRKKIQKMIRSGKGGIITIK